MADIGISSNSVLRQFSSISGTNSANFLSEDGYHISNSCSGLSEDTENKHNYSEKHDLEESKAEYEATLPIESNEPTAGPSAKGLVKEETQVDNQSVWLTSSIIKSEIEDPEEKVTESVETEDTEDEEEKEDKTEEEDYSKDEDDSDEGAYHLAEVSYGEGDEQYPEKGAKRESESILGVSHDAYKTTNSETNNLKYSNNYSKNCSAKNSYKKREEPITSKSGKINNGENFVCPICGDMTSTHALLLNHIHKHTKENVQFCSHCNKRFSHRSNLIQYITIKHTDLAQFKCEVCRLTFVKNSVFLRHQRMHTGERPFACSRCSYRSKNASCLKDHMKKERNRTCVNIATTSAVTV